MTHIELGVAAWDVTVLVVGYATLFGIGAGRLRPDLRLAPLAFLTGWTVLGVGFSVGVIVGFDPSVLHVLLAATTICTVAAFAGKRIGEDLLLGPAGVRKTPRFVADIRQLGFAPLLLGAGLALGACAAVWLLVQSDSSPVVYAGVVAVAAGIVAAVPKSRRVVWDGLAKHWSGCLVLLSSVAILTAAVSAVIVAVKGTWAEEWDSWWIWLPRAETIYYWHGLNTAVGGWPSFPHPEYPPLLAVVYAASWHFGGGFHPSLLPLQQVILAIAFLGSVLVLLDRYVPRWLTFAFVSLLAVAPEFWSREQTLMADSDLAYLCAAAALVALLWLWTGRRRWLAFGVLFTAGASLTKVEGLDFALLIISGTAVGALLTPGRSARQALVLLAGPLFVVPWRVWLGEHGLPTSSTDYHLSDLLHPSFLGQRVHRLTTSLHWLVDAVFQTSQWEFLLPLALVATALAARRFPGVAVTVVLWLVISFAGLATIYWIGSVGLEHYLASSATRVSSTIVIVAATIAPVLLAMTLDSRSSPAVSTATRPVRISRVRETAAYLGRQAATPDQPS